MKVSDSGPTKLRAQRVSADAAGYLRSMSGREVRAAVVRGAMPGQTALLKLAGHLLEARVESGSLREATTVFFKVNRQGSSFRLSLLGNQSPSAEDLSAKNLAKELTRLLGRDPFAILRAIIAEQSQDPNKTESPLARIFENPVNPEAALLAAWEEPAEETSGKDDPGERNPKDPKRNPDSESGRDSRSEEQPDPEKEAGSQSNYEFSARQTQPGRVDLRLAFPVLGVITAALILDGSGHLSITLCCEHPRSVEDLRARSPEWQEKLAAATGLTTTLNVTAPEESIPSGLDLRA